MNTTLEAQMVTAINGHFTDRADREWAGDWADADAHRRYVATLRTGHAYSPRPGVIVASVHGPHASTWGYTASEALDWAASEIPAFAAHFDTASIDRRGRSFELTWAA